MSKMFLFVILFMFTSYNSFAEPSIISDPSTSAKSILFGTHLPGFIVSPYFSEQICMFNYDPEIRVFINAPAVDAFDPNKRTEIAIFALPNGNTIEQTIGKKLNTGDDWHYDIQHIGAQTRFHMTNRNFAIEAG